VLRRLYTPPVAMRITARMSAAGLVPFGDGDLVLPGRYTVEVDDPEVGTMQVEVVVEGGRPVCEALEVRRHHGGPPVSAESLRRVALGRYLRASAALAAMRVRENQDGSMTVEPVEANDADEAGRLRDADKRAGGRGRRRTITDDHLREVAAVYTAELVRAREGGQRAPTAAVAKRWAVAAPTASRWVRLAREAGHLGPPRDREGQA
jgi:hypothetical protein